MAELPDPGTFGATFEAFMHAMVEAADAGESPFAERLAEHLGQDPAALPVTGLELALTEQANLQLALDAVLADAEVIGVSARHVGFGAIGMAELLAGRGLAGAITIGPVKHLAVAVGDGRTIACIAGGVFLAEHAGAPVALSLTRSGEHPMRPSALLLEGVSPSPDAVPALLDDLRAAMREHNVFRGRVISLHASEQREISVRFHDVPQVARTDIVLPPGTLERLERHALGIAEHAERLRAAGRHLKRGVLLHGPPGTGKTLAVRYLLGASPGRTTILLTGRALGLVEQALAIGRDLAPATFVFEDIDLVATERTMAWGTEGVLMELLNQMEGLAEDEDLLFLLTSNRPDVLEPALCRPARPRRPRAGHPAARRGRPPPADRALRRRHRDDDATMDDVVARSHGVSGAFIKELVRQTWLRAALEDRDPPLATDLVAVLGDLLDERSALTRRLLGQPSDGAGAPSEPAFPPMLQAMRAAGLPMSVNE